MTDESGESPSGQSAQLGDAGRLKRLLMAERAALVNATLERAATECEAQGEHGTRAWAKHIFHLCAAAIRALKTTEGA